MFNIDAAKRALTCLLALTLSGYAATITLKSGEKIEGKILSKTDTEVTVEVQMTATIKDERVIKAADIESIAEPMPGEDEWPALAAMALGEESMQPADYQRADSLLSNFIAAYATSKHVKEAKEKLAAFQAEAKRVEAGELKFEGKWLSKEDVERERVQITGKMLFARMQRHATAGQLVEAMSVFSLLEKEAPGAASFPDAVDLSKQILPSLKAAAEQRRAQLKQQGEESKRRLANVTGTERQQLEQIQKRRDDANKTGVEAYQRTGTAWMPLNPATDTSLASLLSKTNTELGKYSRGEPAKMRESIALAQSAVTALAAKNLEKAQTDLSAALSAWGANELAKRLQPELAKARTIAMNDKAEAAKAEALAAAEAKKATPTPKPKPKLVAAEEPVATTEKSGEEDGAAFYSKPVFWVFLVVACGFVFAIRKFLSKFSDPSKNLLDQ